MFRSLSDHPQGDTILVFTSVTKLKMQQACLHVDKSLARQEGNKLGSMSGTRAISTTSKRELSPGFFPAR
jgi:hypothetical protein